MIFKESDLIINVGKKPKNKKIRKFSNRDKNIRDRLLKKIFRTNLKNKIL